MKRIAVFIICVSFGLIGCEVNKQDPNKMTNDYSIKEIEGCEYIEVSFWIGTNIGYYSLTHKGNCKNDIHKLTIK